MKAKLYPIIAILFLSISCNSKEKDYYENGNLKFESETNSSGKLHGVSKEYYENGNIKSEVEWKNGVENGSYTEYFVSGDIKVEGFLIDGDFTYAIGYDSIYRSYEKRTYYEGNISFVERFDKNGNVKDKYLLPIIESITDTVIVKSNYCIKVKFDRNIIGDIKLIVGNIYGNETMTIDTINYNGSSFNYCINVNSVGVNEIRGLFIQEGDSDSISVNGISFTHPFVVTSTSADVTSVF